MNLPFEQFLQKKKKEKHQGPVIILIIPDMNLSFAVPKWSVSVFHSYNITRL